MKFNHRSTNTRNLVLPTVSLPQLNSNLAEKRRGFINCQEVSTLRNEAGIPQKEKMSEGMEGRESTRLTSSAVGLNFP